MRIIDVRARVSKHPTKSLTYRNVNSITDVVLHHGATLQRLPGSNYLAHLKYHVVNLGWNCGGYTFGIHPNGDILQGYGLNVRTNHVGNYNSVSLGIIMVGDFRYEKPTKKQWESLYWLLGDHLPNVLPNKFNIKGHQEIPGYSWKPCPSLDMNVIRRNVVSGGITTQKESVSMMLKIGDRSPDVKTLQENLNKLGHNAGTADGIFGPATNKALKSFQRAVGIAVDGIAGPQTFAKITALTRQAIAKKESATFTLGGKKFKIEEV